MASTRVVLPWSTWAMMAMLRMGWVVGELTAKGFLFCIEKLRALSSCRHEMRTASCDAEAVKNALP
jgi:hypothetical protein